MWGDNVLEEVRAVREAHAARFGFNLKEILADIRRRETMSSHPLVLPENHPAAPNGTQNNDLKKAVAQSRTEVSLFE